MKPMGITKHYLLKITLYVVIFILPSCISVRNDKFGLDWNEERKQLGLPIIKDDWTLKKGEMYDGAVLHHGPIDHAIWFTNNSSKDKTLPYHAYKTIHFSGDTLIAETDTYLNRNYRWFKNGIEITDSTDSLKNKYEKYNCLKIIYVYKQLYTSDKNFSSYALGFNYEIQGEKDGFSDIQNLNSKQAEEILKYWNLNRLNY